MLAVSPGTDEKRATHIALVLLAPATFIMPDAVMVPLPRMGWRNSAEVVDAEVFMVTAALFAIRVAGRAEPGPVPVLTATAWLTPLPGVTNTSTPGSSVTVVGVPVLPTLMPLG